MIDAATSSSSFPYAFVKRISTAEELKEAHEIRFTVFVDEQGCSPEGELDDIDPECTHWLLYVQESANDTPIPGGTIRMVPYKPTVVKLGRLCILKQFRKRGYGQLLISALEKHVLTLTGIEKILLHGQCSSRGFYESAGYSVESEEVFIEEGIEHVKLSKLVSRKN